VEGLLKWLRGNRSAEERPVPDDDARHALDPEFLDALRNHNLLYDRDERGGEFLHAYTETLDQRFFLEIVERRGGYDGYGAPNAAVRLAAQARQRALAAQGTSKPLD